MAYYYYERNKHNSIIAETLWSIAVTNDGVTPTPLTTMDRSVIFTSNIYFSSYMSMANRNCLDLIYRIEKLVANIIIEENKRETCSEITSRVFHATIVIGTIRLV